MPLRGVRRIDWRSIHPCAWKKTCSKKFEPFKTLIIRADTLSIRVLGISDGNPKNRVISVSATSRVRVEFDTCTAG
jgi:hypothetical protein